MAKSGGNNKMLPMIIGGVVVLAGAAYFFMSGGETEPAPAPQVRAPQQAPQQATPVSTEVKPERTQLPARTRDDAAPTRETGRTATNRPAEDPSRDKPKRPVRGGKKKSNKKAEAASSTAPVGTAAGDIRIR